MISSRTLYTPPSVLTQLGSTLPSPIVTSSAGVIHLPLQIDIVDNIVTVEKLIEVIKTACEDESNIDEDKIFEVQSIALACNYNIPPFQLDSGHLFAYV